MGEKGAEGRRHPRLLIIATPVMREAVDDVFSLRGFDTFRVEDLAALRTMLSGAPDPEGTAVVVEASNPWGARALAALVAAAWRPVIVALVDNQAEVAAFESLADVVIAKPLDRGLLFARVVSVLSDRRRTSRKRPASRQAKLTGLVGPVEGNELFRRLIEELETIILPVNAGAILEKLTEDVGTSPFRVTAKNVLRMIETGGLSVALSEFAARDRVDLVVAAIRALVERRQGV